MKDSRDDFYGIWWQEGTSKEKHKPILLYGADVFRSSEVNKYSRKDARRRLMADLKKGLRTKREDKTVVDVYVQSQRRSKEVGLVMYMGDICRKLSRPARRMPSRGDNMSKVMREKT